ncbi:MAG: RpiB/LacA/LacB family sugar-phosphate isomerase [Candidatus Aenigmarchaeota archaeon]|nr:RpiB/LacA/LacB family sugar-phosphate isomerase [Candidatus Aenigmarchaeota archaeon]
MNKTIYLGADHAGFESKEKIKKYLLKKRYKVIDCGNTVLDTSDDYPDFAYAVAKKVVAHKGSGILFCGSAEGMSIAANKVREIRAVVAHDIVEARLTRKHNNANVLCLSGWHTPIPLAKRIINIWLQTTFSNEQRHKRRLRKIIQIEESEL